MVNSADEIVEMRQYHGRIEVAESSSGVAVRRHDTEALEWLPPDLRAFRPAPRGEYTLRASDEVVTNPDVLATWTVRRNF